MESSWDHAAASSSRTRGLGLTTRSLRPLAAPVVTPEAALLAAGMAASGGALRGVLDALGEGPGSAVDDVQELYSAGLPSGLHGNLHAVAQTHRLELLRRHNHVKALRAALVEARNQTSEEKAQSRPRRSGKYDAAAANEAVVHPAVVPAPLPSSVVAQRGSAQTEAQADPWLDECQLDDDDDDPLGGVSGTGQPAGSEGPSSGAPLFPLLPRGSRVATLSEELTWAMAATDYMGWLFEHGVTDRAAIAAAGVSRNFLFKRHCVSGLSRRDLLRARAEEGGKRAQRDRSSREGLPSLEELPFTLCCDSHCGIFITPPCYKYWWEQVAAAADFSARRSVLARLMWNVIEGDVMRLCSGRIRMWLNVGPGELAAVLRALRAAVGGAPQLAHELTGSGAPGNAGLALPAEVLGFILERTRANPEGTKLKAIDPTMSSCRGLHKGFCTHGQAIPSTTFKRYVKEGLLGMGLSAKVTSYKADHNVCTECKAFTLLIDQLQLDAADKKRLEGESSGVVELRRQKGVEEEKFRKHLEVYEYNARKELNLRVDRAQALRKHNLRPGGAYERAALPVLDSGESDDEDSDDRVPPQLRASIDAARAKGRVKYVPFNTVAGMRIFHIDDKSAVELPSAIDGVVGDARPPCTVHINGQHDAVTSLQMNYLSWGAGSKKADNIIDEIIACVAETIQGEMALVLVFDRCALGLCAKIATQLPSKLTDLGLATVVECYFFPRHHGKWLSDMRFGGYEEVMKRADLFGLDCLGNLLQGLTSPDYVRTIDPLAMCTYGDWLDAQYNNCVATEFAFAFQRREFSSFVAMDSRAPERLRTKGFNVTVARGAGVEEMVVPEDFMVKYYRPFFKGAGWVGCRPQDDAQPMVFFYMRKLEPKQVAIGAQISASESSRVAVDALRGNGWCGRAATYNVRHSVAERLDVPGDTDLAKVVDQRNVVIAPPSAAPHCMPEWQKLAILGHPPASFRGKALPPGWRVAPREPALPPLPFDPSVVLHGPLPSGTAAAVALAKSHADETKSATMVDVLRALVASVAAGPVDARGEATTLEQLLPGTERAHTEFKGMVSGWKREKAAYEKSDEHQLQQRAKLQKSADKGAVERERGEVAMAVAAQSERNREVAEARVNPVARIAALKVLLGDEGADPPNGTAAKMTVSELKTLVVAYGKHVGRGKKVDVQETKPGLLVALRECASQELQRREAATAAAPATTAAPTATSTSATASRGVAAARRASAAVAALNPAALNPTATRKRPASAAPAAAPNLGKRPARPR